jgi:hypothetical protein
MSSNREIPSSLVVVSQDASSDRTVSTPLTDSSQHFRYFDSVVSQLSGGQVDLYGGGIHKHYAQGATTGDNLISPQNVGTLVASQSITAQCVLVANPDSDVTDGTETSPTVFRGGVEITSDLTSLPAFANIDVASNVITDIDTHSSTLGTAGEIKIGDVIKIDAGTNGVIEFTVTDRNLVLTAGYYEAKESFVTSVVMQAGVPVYGRFTKITVSSGNDLGDVSITY